MSIVSELSKLQTNLSNAYDTISGLTGYPTFGGTSDCVVCAFDLPATS